MRRLVAVCTLFLGICLAALPVRAETRVALVMGNSDYALISPLANPENDAALMAEALRAVGFEVIEKKNADQRAMKRAIRDFGRRLEAAGKDGVGLFYYAG
ncbi:MAG: caspase family protein, partial [Kiloniellales bacterium]